MAPFSALLVEGTSGVGKSTLTDGLIRRHVGSSAPRKIRTLLHLAQSHTYGPLALPEDNGTLTVGANVRHLERVVSTLEWLHLLLQDDVSLDEAVETAYRYWNESSVVETGPA